MKALIFQTMLALLIPGLSDTPKALLTPPSTYDFSIVYSPTVEDNDWTYGTPSFRYPLDLNKLGGNTWSYTGFTWNNTIYSLENAYAVASVQLVVKTSDISALSEDIAFWNDNFYTGGYPSVTLKIVNYSKYPIRVFIDQSSNGSLNLFYRYTYNSFVSGNYNYLINNPNNNLTYIYAPPFDTTILYMVDQNKLLDALYFDVVSPTTPFEDYEDYMTEEAFNSGYNDGYTTAYDEFGNFDWLSSLFSTLGDLLAIEILPGITIGLILLIPIVFGVLRFIMGLFR